MLTDAEPMAFIHVTEAARSRGFYVDVLGLELINESPVAVVVRSGQLLIRITPVPDHVRPGGTVFGWTVEDVDASVRRLEAAGVPMLRFDGMGQDKLGIWEAPNADRIAWFADPDGNTLSITQPGS